MMYKHIVRSIVRNKMQSLLIVILSFLFTCFIGIYMGSIAQNERLLGTLGERLAVKAMLTDGVTGNEMGLKITEKQAENFLSIGIKDCVFTAECYGNFRIDRETDTIPKSLYINASNEIAVFTIPEPGISMDMKEADKILKGEDGQCFLDKDYLKERKADVKIGDMLDVVLFSPVYDNMGYIRDFAEVGKTKIKVAGFYWGSQDKAKENYPNMICPVKWLEQQYKKMGANITYTSASGIVNKPLELNQVKERARELKFVARDINALKSRSGIALAIDDRLFIQSASQMQKNIHLLRLFEMPVMFFLLLMESVVTFIVLKRHRYEIYLARCLGEKRDVPIIKLILEILFLSLIGGIVACILMVEMRFISWVEGIGIVLKFLCVNLLSALIQSVLFMRMNPMKLFHQTE